MSRSTFTRLLGAVSVHRRLFFKDGWMPGLFLALSAPCTHCLEPGHGSEVAAAISDNKATLTMEAICRGRQSRGWKPPSLTLK